MNIFNELAIRKYESVATRVMRMSDTYKSMTDEKLKKQTATLKKELANGKSLKEILPKAFAVVREADRRVLGMEPFKVQIIGGAILYDGNIAEMKTGEGKTLTATMPMYLYGLQGNGNFLITANSYLARRDAQDIGKVYSWLGLTVGIGVPEEDQSSDDLDKKAIYASDIVYTTNSALGFDYLFDNLASQSEKQFLPHFNFALLDEIDAILLDMAQTPLIVSGAPTVQSNFFESSDRLVKILKVGTDIEQSSDKQNVWFTKHGIRVMEEYFGISNILSAKWTQLYRHLVLALKANYLFIKDRDYIVEDNTVFLLDHDNGRKLPGTKLESGLHQAIEAKEQLSVSKETRAMGSITYQNLFRKFHRLSGMTGTAMTDAQEFRDTYNLNVLKVPTNKRSLRKDLRDKMFVSSEDKIRASLKLVESEHKKGRPLLIETGSVSLSDLYSKLLLRMQIPHSLLNARNVAREANMVSMAGRRGAVTVTTSMAGRGTDIKLDKNVDKLGGLLVIGTERMADVRIDNQLKGRAGRQGQPGESVFFVSLEDDVMRKNSTEHIKNLKKKLYVIDNRNVKSIDGELIKRKYRRVFSRLQASEEEGNRNKRFQALEFDNVLRIQRDKIYATRNTLMNAKNLDKVVSEVFEKSILEYQRERGLKSVADFIYNYIDYDSEYNVSNNSMSDKKLKKYLYKLMLNKLEKQTKHFVNEEQKDYFYRLALLKALDNMWINQVDSLQQLKVVISSRNWGQHTPIFEYNKESRNSFKKCKKRMWLDATRYLLLSDFKHLKNGSIDVLFP